MIRDVLTSRTPWRAVLAFIAVLLVLLIFTGPVGTYLGKHTDKGSCNVSPENGNSTIIADATNWSEYAYCQYVTRTDYLCNSLMIFESLERLGSKAARVMMYPQTWSLDEATSEGRMLLKARDEFHVALQPVEVQHFVGDSTWADSFTKLLAFNQTAYKRVLSLDSDATVLQVSHMPGFSVIVAC